MGVALALVHVIVDTNPLRVNWHCTRRYSTETVVKDSCTRVTRHIASVIKVGVVCVGIHVSRRLKGELAWATDKRLQVINNLKQSYHEETEE